MQANFDAMLKTIISLLVLTGGIWLISELLFLDLFGIGRFMAKRQFPECAKKIGLQQINSGTSSCFPKYRGNFSGYDIKIDPESSLISVLMDPIPNLSLSTHDKEKTFDTGNIRIDNFFKERKSPTGISKQIVNSNELLNRLDAFIVKWGRICRFFQIQYDLIECGMKFGNGHYIPASILEPMISDLVGLADVIQKSINQEAVESVQTKE